MLTAACVTFVLTACGGGGGGSSAGTHPAIPSTAVTLSGTAIDGYLQGATVFLDVNRNGIQ